MKSISVIPMAIQNKIKPNIRFMIDHSLQGIYPDTYLIIYILTYVYYVYDVTVIAQFSGFEWWNYMRKSISKTWYTQSLYSKLCDHCK